MLRGGITQTLPGIPTICVVASDVVVALGRPGSGYASRKPKMPPSSSRVWSADAIKLFEPNCVVAWCSANPLKDPDPRRCLSSKSQVCGHCVRVV